MILNNVSIKSHIPLYNWRITFKKLIFIYKRINKFKGLKINTLKLFAILIPAN